MLVQIPLSKLRSKESINKMEFTSIDRLLSNEQKRKIATFFRQEEAKRTKYNPEPTWEIPPTIQAKRRPSATGMTWDDFVKCWEKGPGEIRDSPTITTLSETKLEERDQVETSSRSSHASETDSDLIIGTIKNMIDEHPGSAEEVRKNILKVKDHLKDFEGVSTTRLKKLLYRERLKRIRDTKQQHKP